MSQSKTKMIYKTNSTGQCMCTLDLITRTSQRNLFVKQQEIVLPSIDKTPINRIESLKNLKPTGFG